MKPKHWVLIAFACAAAIITATWLAIESDNYRSVRVTLPATNPPEGCRGHGGVVKQHRDATNGRTPFYCEDGTIGYLRMDDEYDWREVPR